MQVRPYKAFTSDRGAVWYKSRFPQFQRHPGAGCSLSGTEKDGPQHGQQPKQPKDHPFHDCLLLAQAKGLRQLNLLIKFGDRGVTFRHPGLPFSRRA